MSRLSFIVSVLLLSCFVSIYGFDENPAITKGFIEDFFSDTSEIIPPNDRETAQNLIKVNHHVPRFTFFSSNNSLKRVPPLFCLPQGTGSYVSTESESRGTYDLDECDWASYAESLLLISIAAFIIAIIVFPFLFCGLSLGRCCCCGKWKPTPNLCCGSPSEFEPTRDGYTDCCVWILFILSVGCCVVMAAGFGVGTWGSVVMTQNVNEMAAFANKSAYTFCDIMDGVVDIFEGLNNLSNVSDVISLETLNDARDVSSDIKNLTSTIAEYSDTIDLPRRIVMYITLGLPLLLMLFVALSRFCCWWMTWGMTTCGFIFTFLSLVLFGFLYPLSAGLSDVCVFLDNALADPEHDVFIESVFSCGEDSILGDLTSMGEAIFEVAGNVSCGFLSKLDDLKLPCDRNDNKYIIITDPMPEDQLCPLVEFRADLSKECNFSTFSGLSNTTRIYDRRIGCYCASALDPLLWELKDGSCGSIHSLYDYTEEECPKNCRAMYCLNKNDEPLPFKDCASTCSDRSLTSNASSVLKYTKVAEDVFDLYNSKIHPYLNCESIVGITNHAKDFMCIHMINSVSPMYIGQALGAAGCFVGTFVALLSVKRFHKKNRRKYAIIKEGQEAIEL